MSDFKIGFRNLVHRFTGACFQASFGPWEERDFQQGGLLGEFCNFERIRSSKKSSKLRWCYADIFINQSGDWYEFHEWARHFMIQLRFPKALALSKVSRCFFLSGTYPCRSSHPAVPIQNQQAPRSVGVGVRHLRSSRSTGSLCNLVKDGMKVMVSEHDYISGHLGSFRCI